MVANRETLQPARITELLAAIRRGLESLTITGPSPALTALYQDALTTTRRRPSPQEREIAVSQALTASNRALQMLREGNPAAAARATDEMYSRLRSAISATRPD